jgi:indolepyruvate ferredoxin oxidoreductase beta subunit
MEAGSPENGYRHFGPDVSVAGAESGARFTKTSGKNDIASAEATPQTGTQPPKASNAQTLVVLPCNIIIAGVGGQGTVLASKLLAQAALLEGHAVRAAETIGMAQRGGSVLSHVRIGAALSPVVPKGAAHLLIGFEPAETVRALNYLRRGGTVITSLQPLEPPTAALSPQPYDGRAEHACLRDLKKAEWIKMLLTVDGTGTCANLGSTRALNVVLLGAALASGQLGVSEQALIKAIETLVKPRYVTLNKRALALGKEGAAQSLQAHPS